MSPRKLLSPGRLFVAFLLLAVISGFLGTTNPKPNWYPLPSQYDEYSVPLAKYLLEGCIVLGALYIYLPERVGVETHAIAWEEELRQVGKDILGRADAAREALDTLLKVGISTPDKLPVACTTEFSDIASFCAGWRARERRPYWHASLSALLEKSNVALFDFLISLEIARNPDQDLLAAKHQAASVALGKVIAELRRALRIPVA